MLLRLLSSDPEKCGPFGLVLLPTRAAWSGLATFWFEKMFFSASNIQERADGRRRVDQPTSLAFQSTVYVGSEIFQRLFKHSEIEEEVKVQLEELAVQVTSCTNSLFGASGEAHYAT